jgi:hypothetical protein
VIPIDLAHFALPVQSMYESPPGYLWANFTLLVLVLPILEVVTGSIARTGMDNLLYSSFPMFPQDG